MTEIKTSSNSGDGPTIDLPGKGLSPVVVAFALCLTGGSVIWISHHHPQRKTWQVPDVKLANTAIASAPIPPLDIPALPPPPPSPPPTAEVRYVPGPPPPPVIQYVNRPAQPPSAPMTAGESRLSEPVLAIDLPSPTAATDVPSPETTPAHAIVIHNRAQLVPMGTLIPVVLETPADSNEGGIVRAITTGQTRGFDGTQILIPRGSHLIGEVRPSPQGNAGRMTIAWERLVRPDGVAIKLTAPSADLQGGTGVEGKLDTHLMARMGAAAFQSVVTVGVALASRPASGSVVLGGNAQTATGILQAGAPQGENAPTTRVGSGTQLMVFVNRDMDFSGALPRK